MLLNELNYMLEKNKWAKDVKVKKGKMHKLLNISDDKDVMDVYKSGEKLAKALMKATNNNEKKVTGMLAYPANTNPKDNVFDKALRYMKKIHDKSEKIINIVRNYKMSILNEIEKCIKENYEDTYADMYELYEDIIMNIIFDYRSRRPGEKQEWGLLDLAQVKRIWEDFVTTGRIKDKKGMEKIADTVINNIGKLYGNTVLAGHTSEDPFDSYEFTEEEISDDSDGKLDFVDYIDDGHGQMRISDFALGKLLKNGVELMGEAEPEKMILIVDRIFNIVHQRGEISEYFIKGGNHSLDVLAGKDD